jgi:hypothetical protein
LHLDVALHCSPGKANDADGPAIFRVAANMIER